MLTLKIFIGLKDLNELVQISKVLIQCRASFVLMALINKFFPRKKKSAAKSPDSRSPPTKERHNERWENVSKSNQLNINHPTADGLVDSCRFVSPFFFSRPDVIRSIVGVNAGI